MEEIDEDLITFDTAVLAREVGLDIEVEWMHQIRDNDEVVHAHDSRFKTKQNWNAQDNHRISAPTQSELQKWIRTTHRIHIEVLLEENSPYDKYYYRLMKLGEYFTLSHDGFYDFSYEMVLERALIEALNRIKVEQNLQIPE